MFPTRQFNRSPVRSPIKRSQLNSLLVERIPQAFDHILRWLDRRQHQILIVALLWLAIPLIIKRSAVWQQGIMAVALAAMGLLILRLEENQENRRVSEQLHLLLIMLSVLATLRYWYYRTNYTLNFDGWLNTFFCLLLYTAEFYAIVTLILAYFQTLKISDRKSVDLSGVPEAQWFSVDVYNPNLQRRHRNCSQNSARCLSNRLSC
ncbi:hypothetical protein K9N68_23935 [Kovacikia minuta CCNUW1]|uniref:hypothetical protein n=1 Tax=Kovacikia minuta TaxID=2931930 RepID=UPI001CCBAFC1|nr:hypothetical protein K9N68_23935 [Kovacikia minuta CCNUW1]